MLKIEKGNNNEILRTVCEKINENTFGQAVVLGKEMIKFLKENKNGCGIAAPQIGSTKRIIAVMMLKNWESKKAPIIMMINPEIIQKSSETDFEEEGCLSLPGERYIIKRSTKIKLKYLDENGKIIEKEIDGVAARIIQHEIDHLDGILISDKSEQRKKSILEL